MIPVPVSLHHDHDIIYPDPDVPPIRDIAGFYHFHHFMLEGGGSSIISCWLDIERLHSLHDEEKARALEDFFDNYLVLCILILSSFRFLIV